MDPLLVFQTKWLSVTWPRPPARMASAVFEPCCSADLAVPSGVLDLLDMQAFIEAYVNGNPAADLAKPAGSIDTADIALFIDAFVAGCL